MSETPRVVSLTGAPIKQGVPNDALVHGLELLLERARSGDIVGAVYAVLHDDECSSYGMSGALPNRSVIGALRCVEMDAIRACVGTDR